jgi:uncharacterized cofD-like protein
MRRNDSHLEAVVQNGSMRGLTLRTALQKVHHHSHPIKNTKDVNVVVKGGGTAGPPLSSAFLKHTDHVTSVAPPSDSGGDAGDFRDHLGVLPAGDTRRFLVAHHDDEGDDTLRELFTFRFPEGTKYAGMVPGNVLSAASEVKYGRNESLERVSRLFKMRGKVYYASHNDTDLVALYDDGSEIVGEKDIDRRSIRDNRTIVGVRLHPEPVANPPVLQAIKHADVIVFAPGDFYTSLAAILLVGLILQALNKTDAYIVYVVSLMTKKAETHGYTAETFVRKLIELGIKPDAVVVNMRRPPERLIKLYKKELSFPVIYNTRTRHNIELQEIEVLQGDFLKTEGDLIRHDSIK